MAESKRRPEHETGPKDERSDMLGVQVAAAASGFVLSGTMLGMLVTMPVILDTNTDGLQLCRQWARAFDYGHVIGPALCGATTLLHVYAALGSRTHPWKRTSRISRRQLAAGVTTLGMVPFTLVAMTSTNNSLFALLAQGASGVADLASVRDLVGTWSRLHFARCVFPLVGAILGLGVIFL
ncbi:hypothetical protein B0H66DRAFT_606067 [Apodospora peruviana]|uniref:Uncharacterized protein n=1 Tax=Apodospora peruviana TaxID=516989 RepID=A0AAE0HYA9_9PEZI|nr:hypothetical protein B0H66DRAFT_606067 [Apodospora peruviana]